MVEMLIVETIARIPPHCGNWCNKRLNGFMSNAASSLEARHQTSVILVKRIVGYTSFLNAAVIGFSVA
jgi:hypothetical protein